MAENYTGADQFNLELYYQTGELLRTEKALVKAFTYFSVEINLEIILKMPSRKN